MVAHHTVGGCNLRPGDLFGSGTISAAAPDGSGCLLELTRRGQDPLALPNGETRTYLQDGDEIIFRAHCRAPGRVAIGFGECRGQVTAAHACQGTVMTGSQFGRDAMPMPVFRGA